MVHDPDTSGLMQGTYVQQTCPIRFGGSGRTGARGQVVLVAESNKQGQFTTTRLLPVQTACVISRLCRALELFPVWQVIWGPWGGAGDHECDQHGISGPAY